MTGDEVYAALSQHENSTAKELAEHMSSDADIVGSHLAELRIKGRVWRTDTRPYRWTTDVPPVKSWLDEHRGRVKDGRQTL